MTTEREMRMGSSEEALDAWRAIDLGGILLQLGEDLTREGLQDTPRRLLSVYVELLEGYSMDPENILDRTFNAEVSGESIQCVKDIFFTSVCEHHVLPFFGYINVVYRPRDRVIGLSKITRLIDCFAKRLQIQERLVDQIASAIYKAVDPSGVLVVASAVHLCCKGRGVKRDAMKFVTAAQFGMVDPEMRELGKVKE